MNKHQRFYNKLLTITAEQLKDSAYLYFLACNFETRLPDCMEDIIAKSFHAYYYAANVIKGRWTEAEEEMKKDKFHWDAYLTFLKSIGAEIK